MEVFDTNVSTTVVVLSFVLGLVILFLLSGGRNRTIRAKLHCIPGPDGLPIIGNILGLSASQKHLTLTKWANTYGGVFKINFMGTPYVVVTDPDAAKEILVDNEAAFPKPKRLCSSLAEMVNHESKEGLLTCPAGAMWRTMRTCLAHSFSEGEIQEDFEVSKAKALMLVNELAQLGPGMKVDLEDACTRMSLDILGVAKLDYDFQAVESEEEVLLLRLLKECMQEWGARQRLPWRAHLWWASDAIAEGRQKYKILQAFVHELWSTLKARGQPADEDLTVPAQLMRLRDPQTLRPVPTKVQTAELGSLLLAGGMAPGYVTALALRLLAQHPDVQEALYLELRTQGLVARPDLLTLDTVGVSPLLDGVVREALRLFPVFPGGGLEREAGQDTQLGGGKYTVPKGVRVCVYPYAMHRSHKLWEDADKFDPSRWLPTKAGAGYDGMVTAPDACQSAAERMKPGGHKQGHTSNSKHTGSQRSTAGESGDASMSNGSRDSREGPQRVCQEAFMPFGMGQRACLGQVFAQAQLKAALGILVAFFKFEVAEEDGKRWGENLGLHLTPSHGVPLKLSLRNPEMLQ